MSEKTIMVSGGFDPLHVGHLRMIKEDHGHEQKLLDRHYYVN